MEVSVIGNPQAKICRAELVCRELGFRFGSGINSGESRNKVCFLTHQSSNWKEIKIRCSPRSVKCEAIVSDHVPFLKPIRSLESVKLFVGLPLDTVSDCNNVNHMKAIIAGLKALPLPPPPHPIRQHHSSSLHLSSNQHGRHQSSWSSYFHHHHARSHCSLREGPRFRANPRRHERRDSQAGASHFPQHN
ncbi:hypothetical protein Bca52824_077570 [Brassica carinata]|uniref:Uncharacterized protein n=1 Tax=Brassica carinata TaxID=52824 RepID=A0A8X7U056_BRACI|nr:hypothetical protein Bca52824_077570 [Brassica carinata]